MRVFQRTGLAFSLLPLMMAGAVMAGQVSVIPPTVIIAPPVAEPAGSVAKTLVPLLVPPSPAPPVAATQVPQVVSSFPVSAMSTSGLTQAAELTQQAIQNPSLGPDQVEALTNLKSAISGELGNRK